MSPDFDPYTEWLDIPGDRRPPNHYALLGLPDFEQDQESIDQAFEERYARVRKFQVGDTKSVALRVLHELSEAQDCLTDISSKRVYDAELRGESPAPAAQTAVELKALEPAPPQTLQQLQPAPAPAQFAAAAPSAPDAWYVTMPDGRSFGPATKAQLDEAVSQGNIGPDYLLRRQDWPHPRQAKAIYANLAFAPQQANLADLMPQPTQAAAAGTLPTQTPAKKPAAALRPYTGGRRNPEMDRQSYVLLGVLAGANVLALLISMSLYTTISNQMFFGMAASGIGLALAALAVYGWGPLFNSPPVARIRRQWGDVGTKKAFIHLGMVGVALGFSTLCYVATQRVRGWLIMRQHMAEMEARRQGMFPNRQGRPPATRFSPPAPFSRPTPAPTSNNNNSVTSELKSGFQLKLLETIKAGPRVDGLATLADDTPKLVVTSGLHQLRYFTAQKPSTRGSRSHNGLQFTHLAKRRGAASEQGWNTVAVVDNTVAAFSPKRRIPLVFKANNDVLIQGVAWYPPHDLVAVGGRTVRLWSIAGQKAALLGEFSPPSDGKSLMFRRFDFSDDGLMLACGDDTGDVHLLTTRDMVRRVYRNLNASTNRERIEALAFLPGEPVRLYTCRSSRDQIWGMDDKKDILSSSNLRGLDIAKHPTKQWPIAIAGAKGYVRLRYGVGVLDEVSVRHTSVIFVDFIAPDMLASADRSGNVKIWRVTMP